MTAAAGWTGAMLGLVSSLVLMVQAFRTQHRPGAVSRKQLVLAVTGVVGGAVIAMAALEVALLTDDFSVSYVAETSARATPLLFKITTAWSALEGSIVLWVLVLAGYLAATMRQVRCVEDRLGTGALAVMGLVSAFFFGLITTVANPFGIIANPPLDGPGPNPILQNHLMIVIHPPMLYLGFVGFTVPFAFAMSAILSKDAGTGWLRRTRRANLVAWVFLTGGLVMGAWWSYEVLGWGGFWAWDPVENAALLPWLVATAFIHSSVVQLKRGMLQAWNFVLVIGTFALTILGTFLTRSSVISSVHSFSQSPIGPPLLGFFVVVVGGGFVLFALRGETLASGRRPESLASREGAFLVNNVLLTLFAFVVLLGTLYPIFVEAFTGSQVSVGRPFFDRLAVPLSFGLLLAMGLGPFTPYRRASGDVMWQRLKVPLLVASTVAAGGVLSGIRSVSVVAVLFLGAGIAAGTVRELIATTPALRPRPVMRMLRTNRGYWGGQLAHLGLVVVAIAITVSGNLSDRSSMTLERGESVATMGYTVTFEGVRNYEASDRVARGAQVVFRKNGRVVHLAEPRLTKYDNQTQAVGTPAVWTTPSRDIYVALSSLRTDRIGLNIYRYPLMWTLWSGGIMVMVGGLWALGRRPRTLRPGTPAVPEGVDREPMKAPSHA